VRNFKPAPLGESWFDWIGTSPGRIDPESGDFIESTVVPEKEREGFFDWLEVTPGRVNPKTGKLVVPTNIPKEQREKLKRAHAAAERRGESGEGLPERSFSRFSRAAGEGSMLLPGGSERLQALPAPKKPEGGVFDRMFGAPAMNGPYDVGCGPCGGSHEMGESAGIGGSGAVLWLFLGTTAVIALEAFGVTHWSQPKQ
jgi:hypothetical protein